MTEDHTLDYLQESLSNWVDTQKLAKSIYKKLVHTKAQNEQEFAKHLSPEENAFLTELLTQEMNYAEQSGDHVRLGQLNEMYEQLY